MKKSKNSFSNFLSGKGFYIALAVCLIGTGTAAWVAVERTIGAIDQNNQNILQNISSSSSAPQEPAWGFPETEEAKKSQSGVTVSSEPSSSEPEAASSSEPSTVSSALSVSSAQQEAPLTSAYILPIDGEIFNDYSNGKLVKDPTLKEWRTHNGIDIKAPVGTPVLAVSAGKVTALMEDALWGTTVEITHADGYTSIYCGLDKTVTVKVEQEVKMGQQIGSVGQVPTEVSLQEHLHFGMKKEGRWVDPLAAMDKKKQAE